ncbi:FtsX-like permease family protein [Bifidobacterium asteroides]|uniref:FtsX-like permease family protein n=1 Tax=Bifidobacterium asteroides TaxID=1684 RepID=UPI001C6A0228|nr:FtsX-like permease family protein [Bifidobacterium asteroides]QYN60159.1 FtsX-like permease family protein [Bifidobacterium asteroides]
MTWALRDLKANNGIWAGVFVVLAVAQILLCAMSVSMGVNSYYQGLSVKTRDPAKSLASALSLVFFTVIVLGCLVIKHTLQASIRQRRQGLALLSLLGATPKQILVLTLLQVMILALLASLVAAALSPVLAGRILDWYSAGMRRPVHFAFTWHGFPRSALTGLAVGFATAILATSLTLRDLAKMTPVRVARRAEESESVERLRHGRGLVPLFLGLALLLLPLPVFAYLSSSGPRSLDPKQVSAVLNAVGSGPLFAILLLLIALARAGEPVIGRVTQLWTALVPSSSAVWRIARSQAEARSRDTTFGSTVIALTACMFLVGGLLTAGSTSTVAMNKVPGIENITSGGTLELLYGFWAALLIALVGVIAGFTIAARDRDLDLALLSIAGANPQQLTAISILDGTIVTTTGIIIAAVGTGLVGLSTALVYCPLVHSLSIVFPWRFFLICGLPIIVVGSLATMLTARPALRRSPIAILQGAIGE